jgi:hypothetical protein
MAPTEILAEQHFAKLVGWLAPVARAAAESEPCSATATNDCSFAQSTFRIAGPIQ